MSKRLAACILTVALIVSCAPLNAPAEIKSADSRKAAPPFSLNNEKGTPVRLSDLKGKVVLLNFWATWCHGCQEEIPWYIEFADKYKSKGLVVVGVSMDDEGWKVVTPFIQSKKVNYPIVIGNEALSKAYGGVEEMPVSLLIDREGRIADLHSGVVDRDGWEKEIQTLIQETGK
jgi:peroxiredoxin